MVETYDYVDADGGVLYQVVRMEPKSFRQRQADGRWNLAGVPRVLYRLPELIEGVALGRTVYIVEGEKDADRLRALGLTATTNAGGAGKWRPEFNPYLAGAHVVIIGDNDEPGRRHVEAVAGELWGVAASVKIAILPDVQDHGDVSDWLDSGRTADELTTLVESTPAYDAPGQPVTPADDAALTEGNGKRSQSSRLLSIVADDYECWHDADGTPYASKQGTHYRVRSMVFREVLSLDYWHRHGAAVGGQAMSDAVNTAAALARVGPEYVTALRVFGSSARIIANIGDGRAVLVTADGWSVTECPDDVRFPERRNQQPIATPVTGGRIDQLRPLLNVTDDGFVKVVAFILSLFLPSGPRPGLYVCGPSGSAKTQLANNILTLFDAGAKVRAPSGDPRNIAVACQHAFILAVDNLSAMSQAMSDVYCRISTGGEDAGRQLYSDADEVRLALQRSFIITAIEMLATRGDLLDRLLVIALEPIADETRRTDAELRHELDTVAPSVLGAVMTAVSTGLRNLPSVHLATMPRMADLMRWLVACEPGLNWPAGTFARVIAAGRMDAAETVLEADAIATALMSLLHEQNGYVREPVGRLLTMLSERVPMETRRQPWWPHNAEKLAGDLRRIEPALETTGWSISRIKSNGVRLVCIQRRDGVQPPW